MSEVYRSTDLETGELVAVKIVHTADPTVAQRVAGEIRALKVVQHESLVRLLDAGVEQGRAYLVMELIEGETLATNLTRGKLDLTTAASLGSAVSAALAVVHEAGIVHRDVKPANILLDTHGRIVLTDFGIARLDEISTVTQYGTTLGTIAYMAPEQLESNRVGPPADIWSLGIVLLESLTGEKLYSGTPQEVIAQRLARPISLSASLLPPWRMLLGAMLEHDPQRRLSASEVSAVLATPAFSQLLEPEISHQSGVDLPTQAYDLTSLSPGTKLNEDTVLAAETTPLTAITTPTLRSGRGKPKRSRMVDLALLGGGVLIALLIAVGVLTTTPHTTPSSTTLSLSLTSRQLDASLKNQVKTAESAGAIRQTLATIVLQDAQRAITSASQANHAATASALNSALESLSLGQQAATVTASEAATLQSSLVALASSLGVGGSVTTTTTSTSTTTTTSTTTPTTAPGPPKPPGPPPGKGGKGKGGP
jgi:serine/threonine protein kinase